MDLQFVTPLLKSLGFAFVGEADIVAFIVGLLCGGSPVAIRGLIAPVDVFSFDGVSRAGAFAHILQKAKKGVCAVFAFQPSVTDGDTSTSVLRIGRIVLVQAAPFHPLPDGVLRRIGFPVRDLAGLPDFVVIAATTLCSPLAKMVAADLENSSAVTFRPPIRAFIATAVVSQNGETVELLVGKIVKSAVSWFGCENDVIFSASHLGSFSAKLIRLGREVSASLRAIFIVTSRGRLCLP